MSEHPSQYALDRATLGAPVPADLAEHLGRCPRCAAEVDARRAAGAGAPPAWLASVTPRPPRGRRRRWGWILGLPSLAAAAVAIALVVRTGPSPVPGLDATREKGVPQVTVYVKRGDAVAAWDGRTPLRAGDRLRVGVRGGGYAHLSLAEIPAGGAAPAVLYSGPLERDGETVPPLSFRVDAEGSAEDLSVILSNRPIAPWDHARAPERRDEGVWSTRLHLPKEIAP